MLRLLCGLVVTVLVEYCAPRRRRKFGGKPDDYLPVHQFFDESKGHHADFRLRALRHHAEGIFLCERIFGATIINSDGKHIPVRWIAEQHIKEDLGRIPTAGDWLKCIKPEPWMARSRRLSEELDNHNSNPEDS